LENATVSLAIVNELIEEVDERLGKIDELEAKLVEDTIETHEKTETIENLYDINVVIIEPPYESDSKEEINEEIIKTNRIEVKLLDNSIKTRNKEGEIEESPEDNVVIIEHPSKNEESSTDSPEEPKGSHQI